MVSIFIAQMFDNGLIHVKGSAERFRDFIYIDDVVDAFVNAIDCVPSYAEVINIATGIKTSVGELLGIMTENHTEKVEVRFSGSTEGDIHGIRAEIGKMNSILGISKTTSLEDGIPRMLDWVRSCDK